MESEVYRKILSTRLNFRMIKGLLVRKYLKRMTLLFLVAFLSPFLTLAQFHPDSVLVPAACYNFVDDFANDNGETGIAPLEPIAGTGNFIPAEELCLNGNNKHYQMDATQGLEVDNGSLLDQSNYTIELLFKIDDIPPSNTDNEILIMNFSNQSGKGSLIIDGNGFVCLDDGKGNRTCGTSKVSPNYPNDFPSEWVNLAFAFDGTNLTVYYNGEEQFSIASGGGAGDFTLQNNTEYFNPAQGGGKGGFRDAIADITVDYIRYFDEVLDATAIESLNLAAIAGNDIEIVASKTADCIGEEITLTAEGGDRSFYVWSTGDTTDTDVLNYTIFQETDTIWVQGVAVSPCERQCFDIADTIVISGYPNPDLGIVGPTEACEGDPLLFTASEDPTGATFFWSTTGSTSSQSGEDTRNFSATYDANGVFDLSLQVTNGYDCIGDTTIQITINNVPTDDVVIPPTACEGGPVTIEYTGNATATAIFTWDLDGGVIDNETDPGRIFDVVWDTLGTKTINYEIEEGNCLVYGSTTIEILKRPTLEYTAPDTTCATNTVYVDYTGNAGTSADFTWDFDGAVNSGDSINAQLVWDTPGTKNLSLSIEENGCLNDTTFTIEVLPVPTTDLTAPTVICADAPALFEYTGDANAGAELVWSLAGGIVTDTINGNREFKVEWSTLGEKTITLSVNQDGCDTDTTFVVDVSKRPTAIFDMPAGTCENEPTEILYTGDADLNATNLTFTWDFGGGTATPKAGDQEAYDVVWNLTGTTAETKTVTLQVEENGCISDVYTQDIIVDLKPTISFTPAIPASICIDETVQFTYNGTPGANGVFSWDFDGGTQTNVTDADTDFELEWDSAGTKNVSLSIDNNGCITTEVFEIEILIPATTDTGFDPFVCQGEYARFVYNGTGDTNDTGTTFNWTFEDADDIIDLGDQAYDVRWDNFDAVNSANNIKEVTVSINKAGCTVEETFLVEITQIPIPEIIAPTEACVDEQVQIEFSSNLAGATLDSFSLDGGTSSPTADPEIFNVVWTTASTKTISATYSLNGCDSTVTETLEVFPLPSNSVDTETEICDNETASFTYSGSGTPTIIWTMPTGVTYTQVSGSNLDIEISFPYTGTTENYTISAVISNGNCSINFNENVTVQPAPITNIPALADICMEESLVVDISADYDANNTYSWKWDGATVENYNGAGIWTVSWPTSSTKNITLTASSPSGCISTDTETVSVGYMPQLGDLDVPAEVCDGQDFDITYLGDASKITDFTWTETDGGTFNFDGTDTWTVNFADPGEKNVSLELEGGNGCVVDTSFTIDVNFYPEFQVSSNATCTNIEIYVSYADGVSAGTWDFGIDAVWEEVNDTTYSVYYESAGTKTIELEINGACGTETQSETIEVSEGPEYSVYADDKVCKDDVYEIRLIEATGTDIEIIGYELIPADDNATASISADGLRLFIENWDSGGYKEAILEVQDNSGNSCPVKFESKEYAVYNFIELEALPNNGCINDVITVNFTGVVEDGATFTWDFDGADVTEIVKNEQYELTWTDSGEKIIDLEIEGNCNTISDNISINIGDPADTSLDFPTQVCAGEVANIVYDMSLLTTSSPVTGIDITYHDIPNVTSNDDPANGTFAPVWNNPGVKNFTLTVNNGGCIETADYQIEVFENPLASFTRSKNIICTEEDIDIIFNGNLPAGTDVTWTFQEDAAGDITENTPNTDYTVSWQTPGTKTISLELDNGGCVSTFSRTVEVNPYPEFDLVAPTNVCRDAPFIVSLTNNSTAGFEDFDFTWDYGGATLLNDLGNEKYELKFPTSVSKNISVEIIGSGGCENILTQSITVDPAPNVVYNATPLELCVDEVFTFEYTGVSGTDYQAPLQPLNWIALDGGTLLSNSSTISTISWDSAGTKEIRVEIEDDRGCPSVAIIEVEVLPLPTMTFNAPNNFCIDEEFIIRYTGDADPSSDTFVWTFDQTDLQYATKIAGEQAYRIVYNSGGSRTTSVEVTNANGCVNTADVDVNIFQGPTDFSVAPGPVCAFDEIQFYLGTDTFVSLDPGEDGVTNSTNENLVSWTTAGTKIVTLAITNGDCIITREFEIEVIPTPLGEITVSNACVGQKTLITYGGDGAASIYADYDWGTSFADAVSVSKLAGQEAYEVVWDSAATYPLSVDIKGLNDCENTITADAQITPTPTVDFNMPATVCEFTERELFVLNPNANYNYSWDLGPDGVLVSANANNSSIIARWEKEGDTDVSVTAEQNGCTYTRTRTVRVLNGPNPLFSTPLFCLDDNLTPSQAVGVIEYLGDNDLTNDTFDWDFDIDTGAGESATQIGTSQDYDVVYTTPGRKTVSLTVTNDNCGSRTITETIFVNNLAEFSIESENDELCKGAVATVVFTGGAETNATFDWDFDIDTSLGEDSVEVVKDSLYEITYNTPGKKYIKLDITGPSCNNSTFLDSLVVAENPTSTFDLSATENCLGDLTTVEYTGTTSNAGQLIWDWADGQATEVSDGVYEVSWPTGGVKEISLVVQDGGCDSKTTTKTVNVYDNSASQLILDNNLCVGDVGTVTIDPQYFDPGATWSWTFSGLNKLTTNANETEITYIADSPGQKTIRFQIEGSLCQDFDTTMVVNVGEELPFDISADTKICSSDSSRIVFNLPMVNGRELTWDFDNPSSVTKISNTREDYFVSWDTLGVKDITVTINNKGCIRDSTFQVEVNQLPSAQFEVDDYLCSNDVLMLVPEWPMSGLTLVEWTYNYNGQVGTIEGPDFELALSDSGSIEVTLRVFENGCANTYTTTVEIRGVPETEIQSPDFICLEGLATVTYTTDSVTNAADTAGALSFDWGFGGATTVNDLGNEVYELGWDEGGDKSIYLVTMLNGCPSDTAFHTLNVFSLDNLQFDKDTICQHNTATVTFEHEGLDIQGIDWDFDGAEVISGSGLGPYELFWERAGTKDVTLEFDGFICSTNELSKSIVVERSTFPEINISGPELVCENTDVSMDVTTENGGDNPEFEWFVNGESIGNKFDSTLISDQDIIQAKLISDAECVINNEALSNEYVVNLLNYIYEGNTYANPSPVCIGDSVVVSLDPGNYTILDWEISDDLENWESLAVSNPELIDFPKEVTYYRARIIDKQGLCPQTTPPATAEVVPYNPIEAGNDLSIREGDSRVLEATKGTNFVWQNDISIESDVRNSRVQVSPKKTTTYFVNGLTVDGCPDIDSVTVIVRPPIDPPNVFSPNGDGVNDIWELGPIGQYPDAEIKIYNRWGKELFYSIGYDEPWNGSFNGETLAPGVYYYVINLNDGYEAVTGTITILY